MVIGVGERPVLSPASRRKFDPSVAPLDVSVCWAVQSVTQSADLWELIAPVCRDVIVEEHGCLLCIAEIATPY